jgi:hypothetical protein
VNERDHLEDLSVDGKIILELFLGKYGWTLWIGFICGPVAGPCERGNEPSVFIKGVEFRD